ncbi:MAG: hypothetical protein ACLSH1_07205 [Clostridia bacterium]
MIRPFFRKIVLEQRQQEDCVIENHPSALYEAPITLRSRLPRSKLRELASRKRRRARSRRSGNICWTRLANSSKDGQDFGR